MNYSLKELLDIPRLQKLVVSLDQISTMPTAIVDIEGSILVDMVWQDICAKFHHMNPTTKNICLKCDQQIKAHLGERAETVYQCPLGLRHSIVPIIVEEKHLGNVLTGQHFSESHEEAFFIAQASHYGFNEDDYLEALRKVPLFSVETLQKNLNFIHGLTQMLAEQGLQNKRLQESRERRSIILQTAICGFWLADMQGRLLEVNEAYCQMSGYNEKELLTMRIHDLEALERDEETDNRIRKIKETGQDHFESRHRRKDGTLFDVEVNTQYQPFDGGQCVAFLRDITESKNAENALVEAKAFTENALNTITDIFYSFDLNSRFLYWNKTFNRVSGYSDQELSSMSPSDFFHGDDIQRISDSIERVFQDGSSRVEALFVTKDGSKIPCEFSGSILRDSNNNILGFSGIGRDITDRKQAEKLLLNEKALLRSVIDSTTDLIYFKDCNGIYIGCNKAAEKFIGLPEHEQIGKSDFDFLDHEIAEAVRKFDQIVITDRVPVHVDEQVNSPITGSLILNTVKAPIIGSDGQPIGLVGISRDITERKRTEEANLLLNQQLQHTQKLESLGVLAGGIAHDFNNILAIIMGYCSLTKLNYQKAEKNIPLIETAAERAAGLCRQMMAYAGKAQLTMTRINMVRKVEEMVGMLKATLPQNTVIKTDLSAEIPLIEGDASQLRQVIMNLIINSSEAIGTEQGEVNVSLAMVKIMAGKAYEDYHGKQIPPGEYVCLEVTDNGCGMDEETKWRIFEPFYTTKFAGRGLGMSAVLGIIKSHGGALQLFSKPGQGTTFKVYLPAPKSEIVKDDDQTASVPVAPWRGSGTVLLAEDEEPIRDIAKTFLEMFGFTVLEAVNGKEALEIYQKNAAEITLVFTDMGMPVMDGYELFHKLKSLNPELPIIVSSGYGDAEVSARIGSDNIAGIISKPYNPNKLREVLKMVLNNNSVRSNSHD